MSFQITTAFVQQYKSNVQLLSQQKGSKLRGAVRVETLNAEYGYFDQIGTVTAQLKTSRHGDTPQYDTPHARRRVSMNDYEWADLVDKEDEIRTLNDPKSAYAKNAVWAFGRAMDDEVIAAATGTAYTGKAGATSVTFPAGQIVDSGGGSAMTIAKLRATKKLFWDNDVDEDIPLFIAMGPKQFDDLLGTTEVTSSDYNTVKALVQGDIDTFMGFKFIRTTRLAVASSIRACIAWAKDGLLLSVGADIKTEMSKRPDKSYATQVYCSMSVGATRMEEEKVVRIDCTEA
jgi:hypothetical protein